jgi:CBS domain-containing protein
MMNWELPGLTVDRRSERGANATEVDMFTILKARSTRETSAHAGSDSAQVMLRAADIMTTQVATVSVNTPVKDIARLFVERGVSAAPVMAGGTIVGIVSNGDLLRRAELGTEADMESCGLDPHCSGRFARDVMTVDIVCALEDTSLAEIAHAMQDKKIRRVPVLRGNHLVGIVSREDIVRVLAGRPDDPHPPELCDDDVLRYRVIETLLGFKGASAWLTEVSVSRGVVDLTGTIEEEAARTPSRIAVAQLPCVKEVRDRRNWVESYGA